jgi:hypothetical protein
MGIMSCSDMGCPNNNNNNNNTATACAALSPNQCNSNLSCCNCEGGYHQVGMACVKDGQ